VVISQEFAPCISDKIFTAQNTRFHETEETNASHVTSDLTINSTQLTDAGVYLCAEETTGLPSSSAQLIVLGNYIGSAHIDENKV